MQCLKTEQFKSCSPPGVFLRKFSLSLHVEHEISTIYVFNYKEKSVKKEINEMLNKQNDGSRVLGEQMQSWIIQTLTCFLSENRSAGQPGRDD